MLLIWYSPPPGSGAYLTADQLAEYYRELPRERVTIVDDEETLLLLWWQLNQ